MTQKPEVKPPRKMSTNVPESKVILISNLPYQIDDPKTLYEIIKNFGQIEFVILMANHQKSFIQTKSTEDA